MALKLIGEPPVKLTGNERYWWDWAIHGLIDVLDDEDFLRDNPDMVTLAGQIDDLKYRLTNQAYDVAETDADSTELGGRKRTLNSLNKKLESFYQGGE